MKSKKTIINQLISGNFIALDFETTGLDPNTEEILEIGFVRLEAGCIVERFSQLVRPDRVIPPFITQLTGISNGDCKDQPKLESVWPDFLEQISSQPLVMHNAPFDMGFLKAAYKKNKSSNVSIFDHQVFDTLLLSRIIFPFLSSHKLVDLGTILEINKKPTHRAADDAETTAFLTLHLLKKCESVDPIIFHHLTEMMEESTNGLRYLFACFKDHKKFNQQAKLPETLAENVIGHNRRKPPDNRKQNITQDVIRAYFEFGGKLEQSLDKFESRYPQVQMAHAIAKAINRDEFFIAEAGTGVGKSLAYLIPFLLNVFQNAESRFVIATHTKTLQEQLFHKELPLLKKIMPFPFKATLLKGRSNYICLRRFQSLIDQANDRISNFEKETLLTLIYWVHQTKTGDIEENNGFKKERNHHVWSLVNAAEGRCLKNKCAFEKKCFLQKIRRESKTADVVVVNHSLLFANLTNNQSILGPVESLVVDEAHHLEEVASQYLGEALSFSYLAELCQSLYNKRPRRHGLLVALEDVVKAAILSDREEKSILNQIKKLIKQNNALLNTGHQFFDALENHFTDPDKETNNSFKIRIHSSESLFSPVRAELSDLQCDIIDLSNGIRDFVNEHDGQPWQSGITAQNVLFELFSVQDHLTYLYDTIQLFQHIDFDETVVWLERQNMRGVKELVVQAVPLEVAGKLANCLYSEIKRGVFTSATLTVNGSFDYLLNRWGFHFLESERYNCGSFGSPFDYQSQLKFLLTDFLPDPRTEAYTTAIAHLIRDVILETQRGTLVLFTSFFMLKQVRQILQPALSQAGILLMAQGVDGSRGVLLRRFKEDKRSVLLGTSSFWEGVDVPGEALENVIITKIPFAVPSEPIVQARSELADRKFGSGFLNYSVPEAIVHFKQGFGRLIRTGQDRGLILMLDPRIATSKYGRMFIHSVPVEPELHHSQETLLDSINDWFLR